MPSYSAPRVYYSRPSSYSRQSYSRASYSPRSYAQPTSLRARLGLTGAMGLNRSNMSGPSYSGPRVSQGNAIARSFYNTVNNQANLRTITKGVNVPAFGAVSLGAFRMAQARGERMAYDLWKQKVLENARNSQQTIVKYRDPRTGAISDTPFSNLGLNRFGSNQGWRYQQNSARQSRGSGYSSGMSQFGINSPSGVGVNRMR